MATSKETSNYKLPIYASNDVTSYLVTWNGAMTLLDTTLANIQKMAEAAGADVTLVEASVQQLKDAVQLLNTNVTKNAENIQINTNDIAGVKINLTNLDGEVVNLKAEVEEAVSKVGAEYKGVIGVGEDTLTVNAPNLTADSLIDVYTDEYGLVPKNVTANVAEKLVTVTVDSRETTLQLSVLVR
nr:MAG TPA: trimeric autotransporter adhesin [Caudoviricetes sp.]